MFKEFVFLCNKIAQQYPPTPHFQIDSFALLENIKDIEDANAKQLQRDFQQGFFWSRMWRKGKALENSRQREFPSLFLVRSNTFQYNNPHEKTQLFSRLKLGICMKKIDTINAATQKDNMIIMLHSVIAAIFRHQLYLVKFSNEQEYNMWLHESELDYLIEKGTVLSYTEKHVSMLSIIRNFSNIIFGQYDFNNRDLISCEVDFDFSECITTIMPKFEQCNYDVFPIPNVDYEQGSYNLSYS